MKMHLHLIQADCYRVCKRIEDEKRISHEREYKNPAHSLHSMAYRKEIVFIVQHGN